jgi:hypothetical protein
VLPNRSATAFTVATMFFFASVSDVKLSFLSSAMAKTLPAQVR